MRAIVAGLGLALLVVSPSVRSASSARLALGDCRSVAVSMGKPVEISTGPVQVPQCIDDNEDSCAFLWFLCDDPEILQIDSIALASCSLRGDIVLPLDFSVESSSKSVDFIPPFSGKLSCDFSGSQRLNQSEIELLTSTAKANGYPCDGVPKPTPIDATRVRCTEKP